MLLFFAPCDIKELNDRNAMLAACHSERCQRCAESSHDESGSASPASGGNRPSTAGKEYTEIVKALVSSLLTSYWPKKFLIS